MTTCNGEETNCFKIKQNFDNWGTTQYAPIRCKWIYKTKFNVDGFFSKHKAHLVAKCYTQWQAIDYTETFDFVSKMPTLGMIMSLSTVKNVQNALLHKDLEEEFFMIIPQRYPNYLKHLWNLFVDCGNPVHTLIGLRSRV